MFRVPCSVFSDAGQSTLEIVIAITVFTIGVTSIILVIFGGQSLSLDSENSTQALRLAEQNLEGLEASSTYNFNELASSSSTQNEFTEEIIVTTTTDSNTKQILSRVSWKTDPLRTQKVELSTLVTNWFNVQNTGGDTGGGDPTGNWCNPTTLGTIDLGAGESATDIDVVTSTAYMTAIASSQSKADLFLVDVSSGSNPVIASSINTGPGLNALDVAGNYAYVAENKSSKQFQVIDISDRNNPILVASATLTSNSAVGRSIFYYDKKIYIGTDDNENGHEFQIIDVSNPANPVILGNASISHDVNAIFVQNNYAYLATSDRSQDIQIFDVATSSAPRFVSSYNIAGDGEARSLYAVGNTLYVGRESGGDEFDILDVTNPTSVQSLASKAIGNTVNALTVRGKYAFLATSDPNNELKIFDISNLSNITACSNFNFPNIATGIDYDNNFVYTAVRSNDGLRIVASQ